MSASRRQTLAGIAALLAITLIAYIPVTWAGYVWDDGDLVTHNRNIRTLEGLAITWFEPSNGGRFYPDYYPLTYTSWAVEYQLWGLHPLGFHLNNVLLHAINASLVWLILTRMKVPGAFVAAAIFAVHPVHVESVAWVSQRKTVLSGLCFLLSTWSFLAAFDPIVSQRESSATSPGASGASGASAVSAGQSRRRFAIHLALSLALYALAMLAKPVTMTLAGVLPLLLWWRRGRLTWREIAPAVPYLALALPMALLTTWFQANHVRLAGQTLSFTPIERVLIAGRVICFYLGTLVWPIDLSFAYPRWTIDAGSPGQYVYPVAVVVGLFVLWLRWRRPPKASADPGMIPRGAIIAAFFFCVVLSPALGFINILWHRYYFVADHVQYLASLGPIALAGAIIAHGLKRGDSKGGRAVIVRVMAVVLIVVLAGLSFAQARVYENLSTLWHDALRKNPRAWIAMIYLGTERAVAGDLPGARTHWENALTIEPGTYEAHYNLGVMAEEQNDHAAAMARFERAIQIKPNFPHALNASAKGLVRDKNLSEAEARFRRALAANPHFADAHYHMGLLLSQTGRPDEALKHYDLALRYKPDFTAARNAAAQLKSPAATRP